MKLKKKGLLFAPKALERVKVLIWLKRVHAWTGFWAAILFLILGLSGFLLNHRSLLKIETGHPTVVSTMEMPIDPALITNSKDLGVWAKQEFDLHANPRAPRGKPAAAPKPVKFMGEVRTPAEKWIQTFHHANSRLVVEYVKGAASVTVREEAHNFWGFIKNLHKGGGLGMGWVLFMDTIAGALLAMTITGFLLWSHLHGTRLLALGIMGGSVGLGFWVLFPFLL